VDSTSTLTKAERKSSLLEFAEAKESADERNEETSLMLCLAAHPKLAIR